MYEKNSMSCMLSQENTERQSVAEESKVAWKSQTYSED